MQHVTEIGTEAFLGCTLLTKFILGDNKNFSTAKGMLFDYDKTVLIAYPSADDCIRLPKSVRRIESRVLYDCKDLRSVEAPGVTELGKEALFSNSSLQSIRMPKAEIIGESAFRACRELWSADMPAVIELGKSALGGCSIISIHLPEAKKIGEGAFCWCSSLHEAYIPKAETIEKEAFSYCMSLYSVDMKSAKYIGEKAFESCNRLKEVYLGAAAPTLADDAFEGCSDELVIYVPKGAKGYDAPEWSKYSIVGRKK